MRIHNTVLALALCSPGLAADFSYTEKTEITGGAMKSMMRVASVFSRQAGQPVTTTHRYKGDRMGTFTDKSADITDLNAETITHIDLERKEYSVITFAEMAAALKQLAAKMSGAKVEKPEKDPGVDVKWKISVDNTGKTRDVAGVTATQSILKLEAEGKDTKSGDTGSMNVVVDTWMGKVPGYDAVQEFQKRMAQKLVLQTGMNMGVMAQLGAAMMSGMGEATKKLAEMDGMPLLTVMRMGGSSTAMAAGGEAGPGEAQPQPNVREAAGQAVGGALGSRGRFGGIGGAVGGGLGGRLGRRKQEEPPPQSAPPAASQPSGSTAAGVLMETTTTVGSFSSAPVDAAVFAAPAGFKQVEHPIKRQAR